MTAENSHDYENFYLENVVNKFKYILSFPLGIVTAISQVFFFFLKIFTFLLKTFIVIILEYPILTFSFFSFLFLIFLILIHIKRYSIINYLLYTLIPYCLSIVFTIFCFFFPHVNAVISILNVALHPIRWILNIISQVNRNSKPIRRTIKVIRPPRHGQDRANSRSSCSLNERVQCCICLYREKSVLLRPCNHVCLCSICLKAVMREAPTKCPICRANIKSYVDVYL